VKPKFSFKWHTVQACGAGIKFVVLTLSLSSASWAFLKSHPLPPPCASLQIKRKLLPGNQT
ncbi:MAG: hypothetical protein M3288_04060, partial [Thermoproteota archaeon]|nr:hypothetical protein [Thermoproteota archaeon]